MLLILVLPYFLHAKELNIALASLSPALEVPVSMFFPVPLFRIFIPAHFVPCHTHILPETAVRIPGGPGRMASLSGSPARCGVRFTTFRPSAAWEIVRNLRCRRLKKCAGLIWVQSKFAEFSCSTNTNITKLSFTYIYNWYRHVFYKYKYK